jgi:hypothetical protein
MPASNRRPLYSGDEGDQAAGLLAGPGAGALSGGGDGGSGSAVDAAELAAAVPVLFTKQPCTVKGLAAALSAGMLGYLFGFVPGVIRHRASKWALTHLDGMRSAQSLAIMSGAYTAVHCVCQRIRQVEDGWNRGMAGCATGLVLGWGNGPLGAAQSCLGIGGLSYLIDFGGAGAAEAAAMPGVPSGANAGSRHAAGSSSGGGSGSSGGGASDPQRRRGGLPRDVERRLNEFMRLPPMAFLGEACRVAYFDGCACNGGGGGGGGAKGAAAAAAAASRDGERGAAAAGGSCCTWAPARGGGGAEGTRRQQQQRRRQERQA